MTPGTSRRRLLGTALGLAAGSALGGCTAEPTTPAPEAGTGGSTAAETPTAASPTNASPTASPRPTRAPITLPAGLQLGAATSAYQIEGAVTEDGRGRSIWDTFSATPGRIADGSSGAVACDHYHRWESDLDLAAQLNLQAYRFSIAWPRIMPTGRGKIDSRGVDFYRRLVDGLRRRGISPTATLFHWDLPETLQQRGGWGARDSASWFADYAAAVFDRIDGVDRWVTINEAKIIAQLGHLDGYFAPGLRDARLTGRVIHHLGLAHGRAVQAFRASKQDGTIGPCIQMSPCYPYTDTAKARRQARLRDVWENTLYLDPVLEGRYPALMDQLDGSYGAVVAGLRSAVRDGDLDTIAARSDFVGVNYYSPTFVDDDGESQTSPDLPRSGWQQVFPQGVTDVLTRIDRDYDVDTVVLENGTADADGETGTDDPSRVTFFREHLRAVHTAIRRGARVRAYFAWSLLDNFEWASGYTQRWGLVHVDFDTQQRTPKTSARWYADVARTRRVD